jgi:hypothetical protein
VEGGVDDTVDVKLCIKDTLEEMVAGRRRIRGWW